MGKMNRKKLLSKTTRDFLVLAAVILLICAPIFYFVSQWLFIYETEEVLVQHKNAFINQSSRNFTPEDIKTWNRYNLHFTIMPDMGVTRDSIVGTVIEDSTAEEKEPFRIIYAPVEIAGKKYTYTEKIHLLEMERMVFTIAGMFTFILLVLFIGIVWLSKKTASKRWKPFYDTLDQIHEFEIDKNKPPHFLETDIDEFERLNRSLEALIEKNTAIYKSQREFVENAAHELQTPLALFQNKIDTLFQMRLDKDQTRVLGALSRDVAKLNRLNKNLLLLSKIEHEIYLEKTCISVNGHIEKHLDFFTEQAGQKWVAINVQLSQRLEIEANPVLAEILINNLVLNAIRHNRTEGNIIIRTLDRELMVLNTGKAEPLPIEKLFGRFFSGGASANGSGLGLAIIRKITEISGWKISYSYYNDFHCFSVKF
ncbi:integral membrane sensor signal transduction histidine kinase [Flavobacterium sp. F52]|uniref:histidine kinase n=2 Tax=Flavobacteriaceae TaxID=49546 RepID=A5FFE3_FLAJ1|nr:integral membrane sensor signal transduction histidine kinase [Flavobacterium johnsoniae UW101]EJG02206.1 integral membrane sensor signal transduction histidine kinase [Flavobacterium sp. F52]OXG00562.1 sensor histidine kinase [Flavobacterium johnsoniae UW101]